MVEQLIDKVKNRRFTVGIIGLGYVGLPLVWRFHECGFMVVGFDIDPVKVEKFNDGISYIKHLDTDLMQKLAQSDRAEATTDFSRADETDALLLCVPTPLDNHREPDMSYIRQTIKTIAPELKKGHLVVLESTTYPGTTSELIKPICEKISGLKAGQDFFLAYSPEREDPGNPNFSTQTIPKVVGADSVRGAKLACALYGEIIDEIVPVSDTKTAEAVKLLENIFRSVNIALVNELKTVLDKMEIDIHEVIEAAATKPFGFMKFTPGPGLGGHCIPIDPFYLTWKAREYEMNTRFIELAGEINTGMPGFVVDKVAKALNFHKKAINGSRILVIGLAYKPDVDDMRESPAFPIMDKLKEMGGQISYYDPFIPEITPTREHAGWTGTESVCWTVDKLKEFDATVIVTNHSEIAYADLAENCPCIIDTRNVMAAYKTGINQVWHA